MAQNPERSLPSRNSLARKNVVLTISVIFAGLLIFGGILIAFSKEYFDNDAWNRLYDQASTASEVTTNNLISRNKALYPDTSVINPSYRILAEAGDINLFLTDIDGSYLLHSYPEFMSLQLSIAERPAKIPDNVLEILSGGNFYRGFTTLGGQFDTSYHVVGVPVYSPVDGTVVVGYLLVASSGEGLTSFLMNILQIFVLGAIAVMAFAFAAMTIISERFLAPIKEVSEAAKEFGAGNYSKRVAIEPGSYDEVTRLGIAFNNMASSIALHEKSSRSFVANVSHELRTPMTTISGFVDGILDGTIQKEQERKYLRIVSDETKRLSRLVLSMLNLSKIEAGKMSISPKEFDINALIISVILTFETRIEEKDLDILNLDADNVQMVYADPDLIHQVLYNLIENAVKFVNENGWIEFLYEQVGDMLHIGVRNSGKGISTDELQQVFDRFYKLDRSRSLDKSGAGLGLYIVKSILTLHGGEIYAKSSPGEYTEFIITLETKNSK